MAVVLGIDPGSRVTGFGVIEHATATTAYVTSGCIRATLSHSAENRLNEIYSGLMELIDQYQPDHIAIERIFMARSAESALKLGQARGVALLAAARRSHSAVRVRGEEGESKRWWAVVPQRKRKCSVWSKSYSRLKGMPQEDAADALAIALCHTQTMGNLHRLGATKGRFRKGRLVEPDG